MPVDDTAAERVYPILTTSSRSAWESGLHSRVPGSKYRRHQTTEQLKLRRRMESRRASSAQRMKRRCDQSRQIFCRLGMFLAISI